MTVLQDVRDVLAPANMTKLFPGYSADTGHQIVGFGWDQGWNDGCTESLVAECKDAGSMTGGAAISIFSQYGRCRVFCTLSPSPAAVLDPSRFIRNPHL